MSSILHREPDWVQHALWWQIFPLGFVGAEPTALPADEPVRHRLGHVVEWLDHAVELGCSGLLLGPVFAAETHGYDTVDHFAVDARLGDQADFAALLAAAHDRGLKVLLDGVFNHVGRGFPRFRSAVAGGPESPDAAWFALHWPDGAGPGDPPEYDHFEGHASLVTLNHENPAVVDYVVDVLGHWLAEGADGWRLDAAYAVPVGFWRQVADRVRSRHPQAYVFGEVIHGDYAAFVGPGGLDAVTQYELWKAIRSSIAERNLYELAWAIERHNTFLDAFVPVTFVGNHDVTRIASALPDRRHLAHALVLLLGLGGTPTVYYGDEFGWTGVKEDRAGGDDAIRPAFPPYADRSRLVTGDAGRVLDLHRELIAMRRRHPWLHRARTTVPVLDNTHAVLVSEADGHRLWCALNLGENEVSLPVPGAGNRLAGTGEIEGAGDDAQVRLPAHGWAVLD